MATTIHPLTGVELNEITIQRKALTEIEAVTVHVLHRQFDDQDIIAHKLGTNQGRVSEVLKGHAHPDSSEKAAQLLRDAGETML